MEGISGRFLQRKHHKSEAIVNEKEEDEDDMGASIVRSEFDAAIRDIRINKATGTDDIPAELFKNEGKRR